MTMAVAELPDRVLPETVHVATNPEVLSFAIPPPS
jgi:hypothetical protein